MQQLHVQIDRFWPSESLDRVADKVSRRSHSAFQVVERVSGHPNCISKSFRQQRVRNVDMLEQKIIPVTRRFVTHYSPSLEIFVMIRLIMLLSLTLRFVFILIFFPVPPQIVVELFFPNFLVEIIDKREVKKQCGRNF